MRKPHPPVNGQQLLVVDDQPVLRAFLQETFEDMGYTVATAEDAFEALAMVRRAEAPLVVLVDVMLLQMTGQQLLRELSTGPHASTIRVVFVPAHPSLEGAKLPLLAGGARDSVNLGELTLRVEAAARELARSASPSAR